MKHRNFLTALGEQIPDTWSIVVRGDQTWTNGLGFQCFDMDVFFQWGESKIGKLMNKKRSIFQGNCNICNISHLWQKIKIIHSKMCFLGSFRYVWFPKARAVSWPIFLLALDLHLVFPGCSSQHLQMVRLGWEIYSATQVVSGRFIVIMRDSVRKIY